MHASDRRTDGRTDRQTDGQTEISSLDRVCIACSAVKIGSWSGPSGGGAHYHGRPITGTVVNPALIARIRIVNSTKWLGLPNQSSDLNRESICSLVAVAVAIFY